MYEDPAPAIVSPAFAAGPTRATDATRAAVAIIPLTLRINFFSLNKFSFGTL
jgi:hypothetical protein